MRNTRDRTATQMAKFKRRVHRMTTEQIVRLIRANAAVVEETNRSALRMLDEAAQQMKDAIADNAAWLRKTRIYANELQGRHADFAPREPAK